MKIFVFAYLDKNLGDDLMIRMLANEFREHELYIGSINPILTRSFDDLPNIKFLELKKGIIGKLKQLLQFDGSIVIGGSIFIIKNNKTAFKRMFQKFTLLKLLKINGMKIATIGCNLGPFGSKFCELEALLELRCSGLVTVRDSYSYNILSKIRKKQYLMKFDDIVVSYPVLKDKSDINNEVKNCLGISVYRYSGNAQMNLLNYEKMAEITDEFINKTGGKVLLFAFDTEGENDLSAAHNIIELAENKDSIEIIAYCNKPEYMINNMKKCSNIIATRFHSAILAIILGIQFLPICYSNKMNNMLDDIGYEGLRFDINKMNDFDAKEIIHILEKTNNGYKSFEPKLLYNGDKHLKAVRAFIENDRISLEKLLD